MTAWYQNLQTRVTSEREFHFNFSQFVHENITRSWALTLWLIILTYVTLRVVFQQFGEAPISTGIVLALWAVTVAMTAFNEVTRNHNSWTFWLKNNLYSSITNVEISLLLVLLIIAAVRGFIGYAFTRASFTPDPEAAAENLAQFENPGANWGAVIDNFRNLMVFRYPQDETWRIWVTIIYLGVLLIASAFILSQERFRGTWTRRILTIFWVLTPLITFGLLLGVGRPEGTMNPDIVWGGLLLTLIIAVFAIVASFPLGVLLALGRRSQIPGVPAWLTYGVAILLTGYFLYTNTLPQLERDTGFFRQLLAFWPLLILLIAIAFQRTFKGNVVAAFSTLYIEVIRGVPLITVLFMSIILFPIFLPKGTEVLSTWRVMVAAALFAAAYLAENVRGGLQSIPKGQYEAADALGFRTFRKYWLIILPQAIRVVIPAIVGQFTGLFKDTTLIAIVGLIELLGVANLITAQPDWLGVRREPYIFLMVIYFIGSWIMVSSSRRMEQNLGVGER
jgi:general L-amino acid transport system permease protein